ncbi:MAG: BREX-1 system phosphatase PglZ type B [Desulfobacula sp.]|jgi:hypothetical protein|nr:BREX-1 system phosphatase PglZ type B [Desulfobacula sp.]
MIVLEALMKSLQMAHVHNPDVQAAPFCILWPDRDRQWEAVIARLQNEMPQLFVLGEYDPEKRTGPAIWLRCVLAGSLEGMDIPEKTPPIFYLPGISRQDLRAVESCKEELKPVAELQYRGTIWSQVNAKDWTLLAFLKSDQGGLGLDTAMDNETKNAMQLSLYRLLDEEIELLRGKRLDKDFFNTLLTGGDPIRDLLQWLDQGDMFKKAHGENEWKAFGSVCESQLAFHPDNEGVLDGIKRLAERSGAWKSVWERYCEAPKRYPKIPVQILNCTMPEPDLFPTEDTHGGWPQWNDLQEDKLREALIALKSLTPHDARARILELHKTHAARRKLVWAELGLAPLALALDPLSGLAAITRDSLCAGTISDLSDGYVQWGWKADDKVLKTLACIDIQKDVEAVKIAIHAIYLPWVEDAARYFQKMVEKQGYPGKIQKGLPSESMEKGHCILFVDGLRFDTAKRLKDRLMESGIPTGENIFWAALPSVTSTGKPAVSPVRDFISGDLVNADFEPVITETRQSLKGGYHFKKLLKERGWQVLEALETGDGTQNAWCEFGDLDHQGHDRGWNLAKNIDALVGEIKERIHALILAGWKTIRIVTDHGWLLLPGGLPKIDLSAALTENKWGRCAAIKPGAHTEESLFAWYWNPHQQFALANGISCYKKGQEYAHGGLSLQECLCLELIINIKDSDKSLDAAVEITDVTWKGLRCTVAMDGKFMGLMVDIRLQAGNAASSVVMNLKPVKESGIGSVVVENETLEGTDAFIVLLTDDKQLKAQMKTKIGGEA